MFTHPALLRQLTLTADQLRRAGETTWSRRIVQVADQIRKLGWTESAHQQLRTLFESDPKLDSLSFGVEHERKLGGAAAIGDANVRLSELRNHIKELGTHPTKSAPDPALPRPKSPDLA